MASKLKIEVGADIKDAKAKFDDLNNSLQDVKGKAQIAAKGFEAFTKIDTTKMAGSFAKIAATIDGMEGKLSKSSSTAMQDFKAMQKGLIDLEIAWQNLSAAERESGQGQQLRQFMDEMTVKASQFSDTIADTKEKIKNLASDTHSFEALAQGVGVASAVLQGYTGLMTLAGVKNEDLARVQQRLTSMIAITNAATTIQTALQKQSAFMVELAALKQKLLTAWTTATAAAKNADTTATIGNTTATAINTTATGAATAAKNLLNGAVAVGKALLGDFTGLLLVGGAALATWAMTAGDATEETNAQNAALKAASDEQGKFADAVAQACAKQLAKYNELREGWVNLRTEEERNQWLKTNRNEVEKFTGKVDNLRSAWAKMVNNKGKITAALIDIGVAQAYAAKLTDVTAKYANDRYQLLYGTKHKVWKAGEKVDVNKYNLPREAISGNYSVWTGEGTLNEYGASLMNAKESAKSQSEINNKLRALDAAYEKDVNNIAQQRDRFAEKAKREFAEGGGSYEAIMDEGGSSHGNGTTSHGNGTTSHPTTAKGNTATPPPTGSVADLDRQIKVIQDKINNCADKAEIAKLQAEIKTLQERKNNLLGETDKAAAEAAKREKEQADKNAADLARKKADFAKQFNGIAGGAGVDAKAQYFGFENDTPDRLDELKNKCYSLYDAVQQLQNIMGEHPELVTNEQQEQLKQLTENLTTTTGQYKAAFQGKKGEEKKAHNLESLAKASDALGQSFSNLGQAFEMPELNVAGVIAQAVATLIGQFAAIPKGATVWDWIAGSIAGVATLTSVIAQIKSAGAFADGGIIGAPSKIGDMNIARVNGGEMILNGSQQSNLFKLLNGGGTAATARPQKVEFSIKGKDLHGVLKNYDNKQKRVL